ncbi:acylglycerol lipase [Theileria orientalis]|uniref:Acylglycerol lipase n=1 Tax=Theileria orientalis TaxID=68886 RepID=A0A976SK86_THEOR|nr:acylglycerol lipase [Theileria orientalis]
MINSKVKLFSLVICLIRTNSAIINSKISRKLPISNKFIYTNQNLDLINQLQSYTKTSIGNVKLNGIKTLGKARTLCVGRVESLNTRGTQRQLGLTSLNYAVLPVFTKLNGNCILKLHKNNYWSGISDVLAVNKWNSACKTQNKFNFILSSVNNFINGANRTLSYHIARRTFSSYKNTEFKRAPELLKNPESKESFTGLSEERNQRKGKEEGTEFNGRVMNPLFDKTHANKAPPQMGGNGKAVMSHFKNRQGLRIRTYASEVDRPKGKVFLVHGIKAHFIGDFTGYNVDWYLANVGEYKTESAHRTEELEKGLVFQSSPPATNAAENFSTIDGKNVFDVTPRFKYEGSFLEYMNNLGYSVYGLDHQGHGMSESFTNRRCYFDKFDDVCYDLIQFISLVKRGKFFDTSQAYDHDQIFKTDENITTSNLYTGNGFSTTMDRCYLMGLSMGGNVVLRTMQLYNKMTSKNLVDALVCLAGMINIDYHYDGIIKKCFPCFRFFNRLKPALRVGLPSDFSETLSMHMRGQDPLYFRDRLYLKMALMIYDATKTLEAEFRNYPDTLPTLFIHSKDDMTCDVKGPRHLMDKFFKHSEIARFHEIDGAAHVISSPLLTTVTGPLVQKFLEDLELGSNL